MSKRLLVYCMVSLICCLWCYLPRSAGRKLYSISLRRMLYLKSHMYSIVILSRIIIQI